MNFKFEFQTFLSLQCVLVSLGLHVNNRTLGSDQLVTLDVLGSPRDSIVVDLETDHGNHIEEEIQIETHECPPCLCLLDNDRDNYFVDNGQPRSTSTNLLTTPTTSTEKITSTTTTSSTTEKTTTTTTTSTTTQSSRAQTPGGDVCLSESCVMAAGHFLTTREILMIHSSCALQAPSWPHWTGARTLVTTSTSTRAAAGPRGASPWTWTGSKWVHTGLCCQPHSYKLLKQSKVCKYL